MISRNNLPFDQFTPINELLSSWKFNVVFGGEIVALNEKGNANFGILQNWRNTKSAKLAYIIFDILWYEGKLLTGLPLYQRREILKAILPTGNELIRVSQAYEVDGITFFESAKKLQN